MKSNRRSFLKLSATTASLLLGAPKALAAAQSCGLTPAQTPGPFYPGETKFSKDSDLTQMEGRQARPLGQIIYIRGVVSDQRCQPVAGANVEIWQACASGRYNNDKDPNTATLDPNFKYWGETYTDGDGVYMFKTIIPGAYPADTDWIRPPHIHFKIAKLGHKELVTQMYFAGNAYNDADLILHDVPATDRPSVIVDFKPVPQDLEPGALLGEFNITFMALR